jgi:hypothetical protein
LTGSAPCAAPAAKSAAAMLANINLDKRMRVLLAAGLAAFGRF